MIPSISPSQEDTLKRGHAQLAAKRLTKRQIEGMRRIRDQGPLAWCKGQGRAGGAVMRMFERLRLNGFVSGPPFEVTEFGLRVLDEIEAIKAAKRGEFSDLAPLNDSRRARKVASAPSSDPGSEAKER